MSGLIAFALLAGFPLAQRRTSGAAVVLMALAISTLGVLMSCGGGGSGSQPVSPPSYTVTISGTGGINSTIGVTVQ
jgi:multidrug efflux pump subunit AcrA (membrane-fusion protein)